MKVINYRIQYLRMGEKTIATNKNGEPITFHSVNEARKYISKARINDLNNPVTFMNKVSICEYADDEFVEVYEQF